MERARRSTAGNRLARLLDTEEEDEFYKSTYGGFDDAPAHEDADYVQEKEADDVVDSDFDQDEDDEQESGGEDVEKKTRKSGTKAYQDPKAKKAKKRAPERKKRHERSKEEKEEHEQKTTGTPDGERKSNRTSTAVKSAETMQRIKIRKELSRQKKNVPPPEYIMPTQEELLEEALITEQENLKSLEQFEQSELERKKARPTKKGITGPIIRYHSFTVRPLVEEIKTKSERKLEMKTEDLKQDVSMDTSEGDSKTQTDVESEQDKKRAQLDLPVQKPTCYERTLLTFENDICDEAFHSAFPPQRPRRRRNNLCAVTKEPAYYRDPITRRPCKSLDAYHVIREAYYLLLEARADRSRPDVARWLAWRQAHNKTAKVQLHTK